jgi:hypothetical protein
LTRVQASLPAAVGYFNVRHDKPVAMITWYSTDKDLVMVDQEVVGKDGAMAVIDGYFARLRPKYDTAEEATAETMFGFQKSKSEFVEICINGSEAISFKYEVSLPKKVLFLTVPKLFQKEVILHSRDDVKAKVAAFFELDSAAFRVEIGR